jgi:hypothetical protein
MWRRSARAMRAWRVRVLAQSRRYWSSRLSPTASVWRILLHAIRSLWAGTNAAPWGALLDTISSGIGSGSGRSVAKCPGGYFSPRENPAGGRVHVRVQRTRRRLPTGLRSGVDLIQMMLRCELGHKLAYALVERASDIPSRPSSPNRTSA